MKPTDKELKEKYPHLWTKFHDPIATPSKEYKRYKERQEEKRRPKSQMDDEIDQALQGPTFHGSGQPTQSICLPCDYCQTVTNHTLDEVTINGIVVDSHVCDDCGLTNYYDI